MLKTRDDHDRGLTKVTEELMKFEELAIGFYSNED